MSRHGRDDARIRHGAMSGFLVRAGVVAMLAAGLAGCSALPDWAKPGEGATAAPTPEGTTGFPSLADTPDKKPATTNEADQKNIADGLAADRAAAKHSDEVLRGGTETPAPPPQVSPPKPVPAIKDAPADDSGKQSMIDKPLIPMPPHGGHATLAEARRMKAAGQVAKADSGTATDADADTAIGADADTAKPAGPAPDQPVNAAPTTPVEVKPASGGAAQP